MRKTLFRLQLFIRFSALGGTVILPLLGAGTVDSWLGFPRLLGLLGVAVAFHLFAYVVNDVVDLPVDRSEPRRAEFPLVEGSISPREALGFALLQIPLAGGLTLWLEGGPLAYAALGLAGLLMTVYNLWGKRTGFPPVTDLVQGIAWGMLAIYGALVVGARVNQATIFLFAYVVVFILMANGVHGGLRDLANDLRCGVRSTAILLGARPDGSEGVTIPRRVRRYGMVLNLVLVALALLPVSFNRFNYRGEAWLGTLAGTIILSLCSLWLMRAAVRFSENRQEMNLSGMLHLLVTLSLLIVLLAPLLKGVFLAIVILAYTLPILTHSWLYAAMRWGLDRMKLSQW